MKRLLLHIMLAAIVLFAGIDFALKTHHIFTEHHHEHNDCDHDQNKASDDECEICDWAVAAFVESSSTEFTFIRVPVFVIKSVLYKVSQSEHFVVLPNLRGPPVKG